MPAAAQRTLVVQLSHFHLQLVLLDGRILAGYSELLLEPAATLPARLGTLLAADAFLAPAFASACLSPRVLHFDASLRALRAEPSPAAIDAAHQILAAWDHAPATFTDSTLALIDAITRTRPVAPVLVWDLGPSDSRLILVDAQGPRSLVSCSLSLDHVLEAVQTELNLRFRGAAVRLFSSGTYDYNESGPKIAAQLAPHLQSLLGELGARPASFCVTGLGRDQTWFTLALCDALQLQAWSPSWSELSDAIDLDPGELPVTPACPASAVGLLFLASAATKTEPAPALVAPASVIPSPPAFALGSSQGSPAAPLPVSVPVVARLAPAPARIRRPALMAAVIALLLLTGGGVLYLRHAKQQELARVAAEAEVARLANEALILAESRAREEAAARAAELAAAAEAARQAEQNDLARAFSRSRLPGRISLGVHAPGTLVAVNNLPSRPASPILENLPPGEHRLTFSRTGHEPRTVNVTVRADATTEIAVFNLTPKPAALDLSALPPSLRYELRAGASPRADSTPLRVGSAPERLADLPAGDYLLTYLREGWSPRVIPLRLDPGETLKPAAPVFDTGRVLLRSEPTGAVVSLDGIELGRTPLTLNEREPAALSFDLALAGYDAAKIGGRVEPGEALELTVALDALDRIVPASALSQMPRPIHQPSPDLPARVVRSGGLAILSLVIDRDGVPGNIRVQQTDNNDFARLCSETLAEWRFSPGLTRSGAPANVRVLVPFVVNAR